MKRVSLILFALVVVVSVGAQNRVRKTLYVYDEVNKNSTPYISYFREAFAEKGIAYDEATAKELKEKDLSSYDRLVIHGMVMAFAGKSPIRSWLKTDPKLKGKEVSLLVTANRWKVDKLYGQLTKLLRKNKADIVDAVSMATKDMAEADKVAAVKEQIGRLK